MEPEKSIEEEYEEYVDQEFWGKKRAGKYGFNQGPYIRWTYARRPIKRRTKLTATGEEQEVGGCAGCKKDIAAKSPLIRITWWNWMKNIQRYWRMPSYYHPECYFAEVERWFRTHSYQPKGGKPTIGHQRERRNIHRRLWYWYRDKWKGQLPVSGSEESKQRWDKLRACAVELESVGGLDNAWKKRLFL